ncbi:syndecan-1 isoform X2, partial [Clarias magur]
MRLHPGAALVVYLCMWIPVAHANGALEPEDQDGSGDDDEFSASGSGSGSGDGDLWLSEPVKRTHASPNTTEAAWLTTAPDTLPEHSTIAPFILFDNVPKTSGHITAAPLPYTTLMTETEPAPVNKFFGSEEGEATTVSSEEQPRDGEGGEATTVSNEEQPKAGEEGEATTVSNEEQPKAGEEGEATTVSNEEQPKAGEKGEATTVGNEEQLETTQPPAEEPPVVPTSEGEYTTAGYDEDIEEDTVYGESEPVATDAPDMETTPLVLSTTSDNNLADTEASGDTVESTTETNFIEDKISDKREPEETVEPTLTDTDFVLDNEIKRRSQPGSRSDSEYARGNASDNDSLLERKEVLA